MTQTAGRSASIVAMIFSSWISAITRTALPRQAEAARAQRHLGAALLAGDVEHLHRARQRRRAPAAAGSTCRCRDRRRSGPRRRRRCRRRAHGRARRCRSAGGRRRRPRSPTASATASPGVRPRDGGRVARLGRLLGHRLDQRVPGAAARALARATSGWCRRTRCRCRSTSPWPWGHCRPRRRSVDDLGAAGLHLARAAPLPSSRRRFDAQVGRVGLRGGGTRRPPVDQRLQALRARRAGSGPGCDGAAP